MLTDERYKQLMNDVGRPNSRSLLAALRQVDMEATLEERKRCLAIIAGIEEFDDDIPSVVRLTKNHIKERISAWAT